MSSVINPHDKFFRASMSRQHVAKAFFESHLPSNIVKKINLDTLTQCKASFVESNLKERMSDILYSVNWEKSKGYVYLLVEHQSQPDKLMPFRVWRYILRIIEYHLKNNSDQCLPIVYPLVFYHGKIKYNYSTNFFELFGDHESLARSIYLQAFKLVDVGSIPDKVLKKKVWNGIMELVLKRSYEQDLMPYLDDIIELIIQLDKQGELDYIESIIYYIANTNEISNINRFFQQLHQGLLSSTGERVMPTIADHIRKEVMTTITDQVREKMMATIADQLREEGRKIGLSQGINQGINQGISRGISQGINQGIIQGMAQGEEKAKYAIAAQMLAAGLDVKLITRLTGLSKDEVLSKFK